jgi:hypothetical protein
MAKIKTHAGKGSQQEFLPNRHAVSQLAADPSKQSVNDYAKATPDVVQNGPSIVERAP